MFRRVALAFSLGVQVTAGLNAQTRTAPSIPNTPAGTVVKAWYDAYGSGDTARVTDFYRRYQPERVSQNTVQYRTELGGFDIVSIERTEPRRMEFVTRARKTPQTFYAIVQLSGAEPPQITSSYLIAMGPDATVQNVQFDAPARAKVIEGAIALLDSFYVFPDVAKRMGDSLRARNARGAYDSYANAISFSVKLNEEVRDLSHDKHMGVQYSVNPLPPMPSTPRVPSPEDSARMRARMEAMNCAFVKSSSSTATSAM